MKILLKAYKLEDVYYIPNCAELKKYFDMMKNVDHFNPQSNRQASLIYHQFLEHAASFYYGLCGTAPKEVEQLKRYLDDAVHRKFRLSEFAAEHNVSDVHLIRMFSEYYHITPYDYLMMLKMRRAKQLLLHSKMSVKEIAEQLVFSDQYYFSNYFKQKNGVSPRQYRLQAISKISPGAGTSRKI